MVSDVGTELAPNVRLFVRLICKVCPVGTVIPTGNQPAASGFNAAQVAKEPLTAAPQVYPHMGTVAPSGRVIVDGPAVKLTCCWPKATTAAKESIPTTRAAAFDLSLKMFVLISFLRVS